MAPPKAKNPRPPRSLSSTMERMKTPPLDLTRFKSKSLSPSFIKRIEIDTINVRRSPRLAEKFKSPPPPSPQQGSAKRKILQDAEMNTKPLKRSKEEKVGISGTDNDNAIIEKNPALNTKETQGSKDHMGIDTENLNSGDKRPVLLTFDTREAAGGIELLDEQVKLAIETYEEQYHSGGDSTMESGLNSVSSPSFASSIDMSSFYLRRNGGESSVDDDAEEIKIAPEARALELERSAIDLVGTPSFLYSSGEDEQSYPRSRFPSLDEVTEATNVEGVMDSHAKTVEETLSGDPLAQDSDVLGSPAIIIEVEEVLTVEETTDNADEVTADDDEALSKQSTVVSDEDFSETEDYESTLMSIDNQSRDDKITVMEDTIATAIAANVVQDTEIPEPQSVIEDITITVSEPSNEEVASAMDEDIVEPSKVEEDTIDKKDDKSQLQRSEAAGFKRKYFMEETCFAPAPRRSLLELRDLSHAHDFPGGGALATSSHDDQNMEVADTTGMNDSGFDTTVQGASSVANSQVVPPPPSDADPGRSERICTFQRTSRVQRIVKCRDGKENVFEHESTRTIVFRRHAMSEAFDFVAPGEPPFNALFHNEGDDAIERMTLMSNENQLMKALKPPQQLSLTRSNEESDFLCLMGMILVFFIFFIVRHALEAMSAAPPF